MWMVRLCAVVSLVSGHTGKYVFRKMPLRLVHEYEHFYLRREGYKDLRRVGEVSLDHEMMFSLSK